MRKKFTVYYNKVYIFVLFILFLQGGKARAQEPVTEPVIDLSYRSTLVGGGTYTLRDTYLSPLEYTGWGVRILSDQMKMTRMLQGKISTQQLINIDFSSTKNNTETASDYTILFDYSYGLHYHLKPLPRLSLLLGMQGNGLLGAIYNTRNGNNPVSAKANINLNISGIADYRFRIGKQPLSVRYQLDLPVAGCLFSPGYGQSYYEISLGNHDDLLHLSSFGKLFAMKNYVTVEVPLKPFTLRVTYLNSIYQTDVSQLKTQINSNSFMIGIVKEIFSVPRGKDVLRGGKVRRVFE